MIKRIASAFAVATALASFAVAGAATNATADEGAVQATRPGGCC